MKIVSIVLLVVGLIIILFWGSIVSGRKNRKQREQDSKLLTIENYELIRDSPYADKLSTHTIRREEDKIKFTSKNGYTRFYLEINKEESKGVKLIGLDGYGIRDREFLKDTAKLIREITNAKSLSVDMNLEQ